MDVIEQNLVMIFGEEDAEEYRQARRHHTLTTTSVACHASLQESDLFDLNRTKESTKSAAPSEAAGHTDGPAQWKEGPCVRVDVPSTRPSPGLPIVSRSHATAGLNQSRTREVTIANPIPEDKAVLAHTRHRTLHRVPWAVLAMADDRDEPELTVSSELLRYLSDRYRGKSLPPDVINLLNQLNQSGEALDSQAHASTSANANAPDQQPGTSKEKKPTSKQKDSKSPKKRKTLDPELLARRNTVFEAQSNYKKCRIDLNQYQVSRTANRRKERIRQKFEELKKDLKDYKDFAERKKIDLDEFILNLDKQINGTNGQDKQKINEEETDIDENEPQVHIVKHKDKVYNIIINTPK
ncbi:unnamed protein product [Spodoptera littoralis]|uniref:Uncharacterized protein n=1 Tax=Spodoptera littoralis TaxID=7109 RepID=A0A9P0N1C8_SPOLI|nr:unnamed protein product [Spodoptera littoralis]CAH1637940.1 unnamed protein product [Spodoptera littoralis]